MPVKFDPQIPFDQAQGRHHRKSIRLQGYNYSQARVYFVTMVTYQRENLFGEIVDGEMVSNILGVVADECWRAIPEHFPFVELGAHMGMPYHVHGMLTMLEGRGAI